MSVYFYQAFKAGASLQSTIDFMNNWKEKSLLAKEGRRWQNPHDHGMLANWKVGHLHLSFRALQMSNIWVHRTPEDLCLLKRRAFARADTDCTGFACCEESSQAVGILYMFWPAMQEAFDAQGRFWWIAWALPTLRKKLGNPVQFIGSQPAQPYRGLPVSSSARSDDIDAMV